MIFYLVKNFKKTLLPMILSLHLPVIVMAKSTVSSFAPVMIGDSAPDFSATSTQGIFHLYKYLGSQWGILFSHPKAFTPVCTTELGVLALFHQEFDKRGVKIAALSVDENEVQRKWIKDINQMQHKQVEFPLIADPHRKVVSLYGMARPESTETFAVRSVYIIDPQKKVRLILTYPASTGRNFSEILRVVDSLQLVDKKKIATPANWQPGEKVVIPKDAPLSIKRQVKKSEKIFSYLELGKVEAE